MDSLFVTIFFIRTTCQVPLMARDRVLVSLDAALVVGINSGSEDVLVHAASRKNTLPSERKIRGRHDLDEVHVVVRLLSGLLFSVVEWVDVVVRPASRSSVRVLLLHVRDNSVAQLWAEAQVVNFVGKGMCLVLEVVLQVVDVHVAVRKGLSRCDVEVANDLVHFDTALETAAFLALGIEMLGVVLALTLFHTLAATKGPRDGGVCVSYIIAGVAAAGLLGVGWRGSSVAFTAVVGVEMSSFVFVPRRWGQLASCEHAATKCLQVESFAINGNISLALRR